MAKPKKSPERAESAYRELFSAGLSKSERTRIEIAKAAISSYATIGVEETNFDRVARACGVTRPLVQHYFGSREALFVFVVKYLRSHAQAFARDRTKPPQKGEAELRGVLELCLDWVKEYPDHAKVWLLFQYSSSVDPKLRDLNSETAHGLHQFLTALLLRSRKGAPGDFAALVSSARM
ncbi:MAG: TetR/AcrR family transcriptional regulator, partial [Bdellovibrionota bacterium]